MTGATPSSPPCPAGRRTPSTTSWWSFHSLVGFLCAFAPDDTVLLVLRLLYGIGMGGEWGLGAALAAKVIRLGTVAAAAPAVT